MPKFETETVIPPWLAPWLGLGLAGKLAGSQRSSAPSGNWPSQAKGAVFFGVGRPLTYSTASSRATEVMVRAEETSAEAPRGGWGLVIRWVLQRFWGRHGSMTHIFCVLNTAQLMHSGHAAKFQRDWADHLWGSSTSCGGQCKPRTEAEQAPDFLHVQL